MSVTTMKKTLNITQILIEKVIIKIFFSKKMTK